MNTWVTENHEPLVPDVSETVGWAPTGAVRVGRLLHSPTPRLRATDRLRPRCHRQYSKANDDGDSKTKKVGAAPRKYAGRQTPRRHRHNRGPRNRRLPSTKEALSYLPNCSSYGLSVMHRYV